MAKRPQDTKQMHALLIIVHATTRQQTLGWQTKPFPLVNFTQGVRHCRDMTWLKGERGSQLFLENKMGVIWIC